MSYRISYDIQGPALLFPTQRIREIVDESLARATSFGLNIIKQDTPVRTGKLQRGWYTGRDRWDEYRIQDDVFYSVYVERRVFMAANNVPAISKNLEDSLDRNLPRGLN